MANSGKITSLAELKELAKSFDAEQRIEDILDFLKEEGESIITEAYNTKGFKDQTGNLHDSYVCGVFLNGNLKRSAYVGNEMSSTYREYANSTVGGEVEAKKGREEAQKFLKEYQFSKGRSGGITMVIAAAMFYSTIVERRGYQVLAHVQWRLDEIAKAGISVGKKQITGVRFRTHIKPEYIDAHTIYREEGKGSMSVKHG